MILLDFGFLQWVLLYGSLIMDRDPFDAYINADYNKSKLRIKGIYYPNRL